MQNNFNINANFDKYIQSFLDENKKLNLISKNDEKFLYEKHIFDSLAVKLFFQKYGEIQNILDIGCGGGFPCVPVAIEFPHLQITGIDSIQKKINAVNNIKNTLHLDNLNMICGRIENFSSLKYDLILFLEPDVEWVQDGDRSEIIASDREKYGNMINASQ